ncbi:MAG: sucrose phosphorylase [Desulfosarcina sp.]|nr:sucrose phosphorylase [Desulfosarcina sp.]MBC2767294.1 sucrose phosphorylase [Desulfosarcina sp.]
MTLKNNVQLIVYPDSLGGDLAELHYVLRRYLSRAIGGVHLLPFYPSSADRGFAPLTYDEVDPVFGTWRDIDLIGKEFDLIQRADGSKEKVWCTFDYEQIDLDWESPKTREVMRRYLIQLSRTRAKMIRMDAFAYSTVKIGTSCFFLEPQVWQLLQWLQDFVSPFGVEILPEVHEHYSYHQKISSRGYWTYDFSLPMLVLHTLYHHTSRLLKQWLAICPRKQITTLDTHDGIGVVDVLDLFSPEEIQRTLDGLDEKGANTRKIFSGPEYRNLDIYQVNCTYYSALACNDDSYLAARAIQFFSPGIPQVYYVGLLAGENDIELAQQTKNGRDVNRHNYTLDEIAVEIQKPVVQRLLRLMEFRSTCRAFDGRFAIEDAPDDQIKLSWTQLPHRAVLHIDLRTYTTRIAYYDEEKEAMAEFLA